MEKSLEHSVTELFRDALADNIVRELRTQPDWEAYHAIKKTAQDHEDQEMAEFERDRPTLLSEAREEIMRDAGALNLEHPTPFGNDKFDKSRINTEAARRVDGAHHARLTKIREDEIAQYTDLSESIRARDQEKGRAREALNRATERRSGEDRSLRSRD